jgi:flagellar biogenesis protein FliO
MFGFVQWDSPLALLGEFLFALLIFIGILFVVRRVERGRPPSTPKPGEPSDDV